MLKLKYSLDTIAAFIALLLLSPIIIVISVILKIQGEDIFFFQKRLGKDGKEFDCYKFTTMPKGSEKLGLITTTNDNRPTKLGRFLRKTKINELPQLINVLKGDMSLIGPRPLIKSQILESLSIEEIEQYYKMRPGIAGAASLYFHHEDRLLSNVDNPEKYYNEKLMPMKKKLEELYADNWTLMLDIKIVALTIKILLLDSLGKSDTVELCLFKNFSLNL